MFSFAGRFVKLMCCLVLLQCLILLLLCSANILTCDEYHGEAAAGFEGPWDMLFLIKYEVTHTPG